MLLLCPSSIRNCFVVCADCDVALLSRDLCVIVAQ